MKKPTLQALACASLMTSATADVLFEENFSYPEGDLAGNVNAGNTWLRLTGDNTKSVVVANSIELTTTANFITRGESFSQVGSARTALPLGDAVAPGTDGTTLYIGFVQQLKKAEAPYPAQILEFLNGTNPDTNTIFSFGTDGNSAAPDYGLLIAKNDPAAVAIDSGDPDLLPHLIVLKIDFGAADADTISVFVDPVDDVEPLTPVGSQNFTDLSFNRIGFGSFQGGEQLIDEIRIGTTFADVVQVAKDTDNDGMPDFWEVENNLTVGVDDSALDEDSLGGADGLTNLEEYQNGTNPQDADSDDDGILDGAEVNGTDNPYQTNVAGDAATTAPGLATDPLDSDSDDDGILDGEEVNAGTDTFVTNPNQVDTDGDSLPDKFEIDGLLSPLDASGPNGDTGDPDGDSLDNFGELAAGTNPSVFDTDMDGIRDGYETNTGEWTSAEETGTNPLDSDSDDDGLLDGQEDFDSGFTLEGYFYVSDPNFADTDDDGFNDGDEVTAQTDPNDDASVPTATVTSVEALVNAGFEQVDITGEQIQLDSWNILNYSRTAETDGLSGGSWTNAAGEASQVAFIFFRDGNSDGGFSQRIIGATDLNTTNHELTALEAAGQTFATRMRIGIQSFVDQWPVAHCVVEVGLANADGSAFHVSQILYTGTEAQATTAGVLETVDTYLNLDDTNTNGDGITYQAAFTVPAAPNNPGEALSIAFRTRQVNAGDQGRATFDDVLFVQGGLDALPELPQAGDGLPLVTNAAFNGGAFEMTVTGLDTTKMYVLTRSATLEDDFPVTVGTAFTPAAATETINDPTPPAGQSFYRVEEFVPAP